MSPVEQRAAALARGNEIRRLQAELRRLIAAGEIGVLDVVDGTTPEQLRAAGEALRVDHLVELAPTVGSARARRILTRTGASPAARLRDLVPGRRAKLAEAIATVAPPAARRHCTPEASR